MTLTEKSCKNCIEMKKAIALVKILFANLISIVLLFLKKNEKTGLNMAMLQCLN